MSPWQYCNAVLQYYVLRVCFCKSSHVAKVSGGESLHVGEGLAQVGCEPVDDARAPTFPSLSRENLAADAMVEAHEFFVHRERGACACALDVALQRGEPACVLLGNGGEL